MDAKDIIRQKQSIGYYTQIQQTTPEQNFKINYSYGNNFPISPSVSSWYYFSNNNNRDISGNINIPNDISSNRIFNGLLQVGTNFNTANPYLGNN